jgi:hypothetical protein
MGINGLLEQLKSIITKSHVSSLRSLRVGIDAYCYLHKGMLQYYCMFDILLSLYVYQ